MGESFSHSPTVQDRLQAPDLSRSGSMASSPVVSPRPGLSRANSITYLADTEDSFTGLTLLDALVSLDSHLDLASRQLKRKGQEWKSRAESTVFQAKRQAEEVLNQNQYIRQRRKAQRTRQNSNASSGDDRIDIDRELAKFREKIQTRVRSVRSQWHDQRVVSLRDKLSFFFGVELLLFSALLVGFKPEWVPGVYTALSCYLFPIRIYEYRKKHYALFLADLCYIVNLLCLAYIWIFPSSQVLFVACYALSHGPLCTAIATWRNSLVFHSVDKVTSLFIHIYPPFVFTVLRHFYPNVAASYPALADLHHLNITRSIIFSSIAYLIWQTAYYYGIIVARKEKIEKQGRVTSFTYMLNNKKSLIGKTLAKIPEGRRESSFMAGQFVYTIVTMSPSLIWLYYSKAASAVWLITFFSFSVYQGGCFYFKVMSDSSEVKALRKELDQLQREVEGRKTPGTPASTGSTLPEPSDISLDSSSPSPDNNDISFGQSSSVDAKKGAPTESAAILQQSGDEGARIKEEKEAADRRQESYDEKGLDKIGGTLPRTSPQLSSAALSNDTNIAEPILPSITPSSEEHSHPTDMPSESGVRGRDEGIDTAGQEETTSNGSEGSDTSAVVVERDDGTEVERST